MSLRDVCDVVYVLHLEQIERTVLVERQLAVTVLAAGGKGVDVPTLQQAREEFDAMLLAEAPKGTVRTAEEAELRRALGLDRG